MAYDPTLPTSRDRVRFALADTADPPALPGGETGYNTLLAEFSDEERVYRVAAHTLEGVFARRAASLSSGGEGLSFAVERVTFYRSIATGERPYPLDATTGGTVVTVSGGASVLTPIW